MNKKNICGAKTRKGTPCQNTPREGRSRCYLHGGNQPRGTASPNYKHGLYSKYASSSLKKVLDELEGMPPEQLTRVDNELKLLQALIMKSRAIEQGAADLNSLEQISRVIERLIKSKQRAVALRIEENRLVPVDDIQIFLDFLESTLHRYTDQATDIMQEISNFKISDP